jgi:putative transposase
MPNHWHAWLVPAGSNSIAQHRLMTKRMGRTARGINLALGQRGSLGLREWFDRLIRDEAEWKRCVDYIHRNPVKAGWVKAGDRHPWRKLARATRYGGG